MVEASRKMYFSFACQSHFFYLEFMYIHFFIYQPVLVLPYTLMITSLEFRNQLPIQIVIFVWNFQNNFFCLLLLLLLLLASAVEHEAEKANCIFEQKNIWTITFLALHMYVCVMCVCGFRSLFIWMMFQKYKIKRCPK